MSGSFVADIANHFEATLRAARGMVTKYTPKTFSAAEEEPHLQDAWAMLFRALNFGESAVWAAREGHGETVAIIARTLTEMAYNVACVGADFTGFKDYALHCAKKRREWGEKLIQSDIDENQKAGIREVARELKSLLKHEKCSWETDVSRRAVVGGMEQDYVKRYIFLSQQVHTDTRALAHYGVELSGRIEIRPEIPPMISELYLVLAFKSWLEVTRRLFQGIPIEVSKEFVTAVGTYSTYLVKAGKRRKIADQE